jgi:hypothetical protein
MSIASFFGLGSSVQEKPAPAPAPATTDPATTSEPATVEASTLDKYKDLWQPTQQAEGETQPSFAVDQSKLMEAAGKLDFTKVIKPEQLQAISRGGDEGMQAFAAAMNAVAQASFANSLSASSKLIEKAMAAKEEEFAAKIPNAIKMHNIDSGLAADPVFKHPAAKPVVGAIARAMASKYPDASAADLQKMASDLLVDIAGKGAPSAQEQQNKNKQAETFDWDSWIQS